MEEKITFLLPENVMKIIDIFKASGHRVDIVGGCVRDFLLGTEPHDYDMTTSATPDEMKLILKAFKTVDTGIKHGTVTVIISSEPYEITTYRIDGEYEDNRHPASVTFSRNIENDLSRRDFTVNAIAYNPYDGLTDLFGGTEDIKHRIIRSVGDPDKRFDEDALRILRAIRFSSVLGFKIDADTASSALKKCDLLKNVSRERIYTEWQKLLMGKNALAVITEFLPIINTFIPMLNGVGSLTDAAFSALDFIERQCALFALSDSSAASYTAAMRALHSDSRAQRLGSAILGAIAELRATGTLINDSDYLHALSIHGTQLFGALRVLEALGTPRGSSAKAYELLASGAPYRMSDLAVNGTDLCGMGIKGAAVGNALKAVLSMVIDGKLQNTRDEILAYLSHEA